MTADTKLAVGLRALVDDQPVATPPVAVVKARGARIARRRAMHRATAGALAATLLTGAGVWAVLADDSRDPLTLHATDSRHVNASFIAEAPGGYEGEGEWTLVIERDGHTTVITSDQAPPCGELGTIREGDVVHGSVSGEGSRLVAGEDAGHDCT